MTCLRGGVTLFLSLILLYLCSQMKAEADYDLIVSLLKSGEANATATSKYISETIEKGGLKPGAAEAFPICGKWYGSIYGEFMIALSFVEDGNFVGAIDPIDTAEGYARNCEDAFATRGVQDARISSTNPLIEDICKSARNAINSSFYSSYVIFD